jgi:hypothetical protein
MYRPILIIARFTLLEAWRTRLPVLVVLIVLAAFAGSIFLHQIAITESARIQTTFFAASARLAAVFLLSLYITAGMSREFNDKGLELLLSTDLPRSGYLLGKLGGYGALAIMIALVVMLPLCYLVPLQPALYWGISLALELLLICALSLFGVVTFHQVLPAASFVLGFYLLARSTDALRLMSGSALLGEIGAARGTFKFIAETLALVLPSLDTFTRSDWLLDTAAGWPQLLSLSAACAVYTTLLTSAALFDLYRKNF